jgi:putative phage repressor
LSIVTARGDSMEPTINNGDMLLVDMSKKVPRDSSIYIIRSNDTLWVKRIQTQPDGKLLLISDNKTYPPIQLNLDEFDDVEIVGKVVNISKDIY